MAVMDGDRNDGGSARRRLRVSIAAVIVIGVGGALLAAQSTRPPVDRPAHDDLLAEVRSLRREIAQVAGASLRAQLLLARLQLEEQRVVTLSQQFADAHNTLGRVQTTLAGERARVRQLEDQAAHGTDERRQAVQRAINEAETQIEELGGQAREYQSRATELSRAVADARTRWAGFNDQLEALERSLPATDAR